MGRKLTIAELGGAEETMSSFPQGAISALSTPAAQAIVTAKTVGPNAGPQTPRTSSTPKSRQP